MGGPQIQRNEPRPRCTIALSPPYSVLNDPILVDTLIAPSEDTRPAPRLSRREEMSTFLLWRAEEGDKRDVLRAGVASFVLDFDLTAFPMNIASYLPSWLSDPLPGSFAHLLFSMFGPFDEVVQLQQTLHTIPDYFDKYLHRAIFANKVRNMNRELDDIKCAAVLAPQQPPSFNGEWCRQQDESLFSRELRMLRDLVEPLRDTSKSIHWITDRVENAEQINNGFLASKYLIEDFQDHLLETAWNRQKNYTIYDPRPAWDDEQKEVKEIREYRLEGCKGTMYWERWPAAEQQFDESTLDAKQFIIDRNPRATRRLGFLPPVNPQPPAVIFSTKPQLKLQKITDLSPHDEQTIIVLLQIAQWLALARGFPAVHLFCDIARLFTIYGVDVANTAQIEFCKHLTGLQSFLRDPTELHPLFPSLASDISNYQSNPEEVREKVRRNCWTEHMLMANHSLWCRDDHAIAWDYPLQTLVWENNDDGPALTLRLPPLQDKNRHIPWGLVDMMKEGLWAGEYEDDWLGQFVGFNSEYGDGY